jgi:hypothetical protein
MEGNKKEMRIKVLEFSLSPKPAVYASARIELIGAEYSVIVDVGVLLNRHGPLLTMPSSVIFST